jgi:hypothetical protein
METNRSTARGRRVKRLAAMAGLAAIVALSVLTVVYDREPTGAATLAGSGDAPSNTTYTQPNVAGMNMGATATWTTPASVEATTVASPAIKAGS